MNSGRRPIADRLIKANQQQRVMLMIGLMISCSFVFLGICILIASNRGQSAGPEYYAPPVASPYSGAEREALRAQIRAELLDEMADAPSATSGWHPADPGYYETPPQINPGEQFQRAVQMWKNDIIMRGGEFNGGDLPPGYMERARDELERQGGW
jgi:hypothetical protein